MRVTFTGKLILGISIGVAALASVITVFLISMFALRSSVSDTIETNLIDVAKQNSASLDYEINDKYNILVGIEKELRSLPGEYKDNVTELHPLVVSLGLVRAGLCYPDGLTYSSEQHSDGTDLSFREFFIRGMEGKCTVTEILYDALTEGHQPINIISKPLWAEDGTIEGVLGMTYFAKKFNESFRSTFFDGNGVSFAINEKNQVVVSSTQNEDSLGKDLYEDILGPDSRNNDAIEKFKSQTANGGVGNMYLYGTEYYYYCMPLNMLDGDANWTVVTVVPVSYMSQRTNRIYMYLTLLIVVLAVAIGGSVTGILLLGRDSRRRAHRLAYVDPVTGGDNMAMFEQRLLSMRPIPGAFVAIDITDFKTINAAVGAKTGDIVIGEMYAIIKSVLDDNEFAAHISGDNYVMFLRSIDSEAISKRIEKIISEAALLAERLDTPEILPRFGIYRAHSNTPLKEAYAHANQVTESIKKGSAKQYSFFISEDNQAYLNERKIVHDFTSAINRKEFEVWYQPKFSAKTQTPVGAEALVRWSKNGKLISPGLFIPIFERNGLIPKLDEYMTRMLCVHQKARIDAGLPVIPVSVNLSRATISYSNVVEKYNAILGSYDIDRRLIELEVTESAADGYGEMEELLERLRGVGCRILMDDFGTGYSSLSLLSSRCFDTIKIDKSLVDNYADPGGQMLLRHIVMLAKDLELKTTVEGVETKEQFEFLQALDVDDIQGYYFSKPLPQTEFDMLLKKYFGN